MIEDVNNFIIIIDRKLSINRVKAQSNLEIIDFWLRNIFYEASKLISQAQLFFYQNVLEKFS